ncbi:glutamine synthetase repressor [Fructilactobacillus fructivorans]|nr:glutamine synthetase repressor [Fructilactobacillus fructivorans]
MVSYQGDMHMSEKVLRKSLEVLPMGTVMKLTSLSSRQIRYYDDQGLVHSKRTSGNRRLYSLENVDQILEIHNYLVEGMTIAQVKRVFEKQRRRKALHDSNQSLSDEDVREYLKDDILKAGRLYDDSDLKQQGKYLK